MIHEYPLDGKPPMMTHIYVQNGINIVAGKGAAERIIGICKLTQTETEVVWKQVKLLASKGYRVIGVANAVHSGNSFPGSQDDFDWQFLGLLGLYDPPRKNIPEVIKQFYNAKINVKILTGDHHQTATHIAGQIGISNCNKFITGDEVMALDDKELNETIKTTDIFARMFPDAKLKVINALKASGEIVAMTGDGVNDGPALKSADIGIAMGEKGTEIARQAADLVLTDDNLERMVTAISEGRKIFSNLKKAVRYIISIHIPIILTASLPVILGWAYPNIFTPIHVIFLELIMGPTCSIFFEREPVEGNIMHLDPRKKDEPLFLQKELALSIFQGIMIAAGVLGLYYYYMNRGLGLEQTRTVVFTTLILANILLTFVNRSFTQTIRYTKNYTNNLAPFVVIISLAFLAAIHFIPAMRNLFQLKVISIELFIVSLVTACISVLWFELYKAARFRPR
jgi:Ca2+-transporting ATPase